MAAETKRERSQLLTPGCLFSRVIQGVRLRGARPRTIKVPTHPPSGRPPLMHNAAPHISDANINNVGSGESGSGCD